MIVLALILLAACSRSRTSYGPRSVSGDAATDSLLWLADRVDEVGDRDIETAAPLLAEAARAAEAAGHRSVVLWAQGVRVWLLTPDEAPAILGRALEQADSAANPYLYARIRFDLARSLPDSTPEADRYRMMCRTIPQFIESGDSLRAMQAFYFINILYSHVWDDEVSARVLARAESLVPDSLPLLRSLMHVNILGLARDGDDSAYLRLIDESRHDSLMLEAVAPMGAVIGADLYRLRGDTAALLEARAYADETRALAPEHPALALYDTYMLRYFVRKGMKDSARTYASDLSERLVTDSPYNMEIAAELEAYYRFVGDSVSEAAIRLALVGMEEARDAYEKARAMERIKPDASIEALIDPENEESPQSGALWWIVGAAVAATCALVLVVAARSRRRRRLSENHLRGELDSANRRLASQHLRAIDTERAIHDALTYLSDTDETDDGDNTRLTLLTRLRSAVKDTNEWERFDTQFTRLRPGFVDRLTARYPNLTKGEIRLASLLSMDLDTKHIARLLNIQPDSVKKGRQRLRAKLAIPPDTTFPDFLARL